MTTIIVYKNDHHSKPVWHYTGKVIACGATWVCLQAHFGRPDVDIGVMTFRQGDLMTEWFYTDRYYNVFRVEDVDDGRIKGWYCNITRPAIITEDRITADDLALDVFVSPSGEVTLLDEDELAALGLSDSELGNVWQAVVAIRAHVTKRAGPFDAVVSSRDG